MTGRATGELVDCSDFVLRHKLLADFFLIGGRLPLHVENLVFGTNVLGRIAMTIEAPLHIQRRGLEYQGHLIDRAMTRGATDALIDVDAVIEIDVIGEPVNLDPLDRLIGAVTLADWFEVRGIVEQYRVAIHAGFSRRNAGVGGGFHAVMTITTINAVVAHVVFVAELHGLHARDTLVRDVGRSSDK